MNITAKNGSTKEKSGRNKNRIVSHSAEELGGTQEKSGNDGIDQNRTDQSYCSGRANDRRIQQSNSNSGKILERLKFIENEYLSYLEADQQQLESRLEENKGRKEVFKTTMQKLEQEVSRLIAENETAD